MNKKIKTEAVDHLFEAILTLRTPEECYIFFEDVCTVNELLSLSQRYEVAKMLREKRTYLEIADKTGASTATISRVNRSLNYGNDGYDMVFARIAKSRRQNLMHRVMRRKKHQQKNSTKKVMPSWHHFFAFLVFGSGVFSSRSSSMSISIMCFFK